MEQDVLNKYKEAGKILAECLSYGEGLVEVGASAEEVCDAVEEKIRDMGGEVAFPAQVSINEVAAHYCPALDDETTFAEGDLVKLDCGVHVDGYIADSAVTVDLGKHEDLVKASREALETAVKMMTPGTTLTEIGKAIQEKIESYGFSPVRNLSGHKLERYVLHAGVSIPNFESGAMFPLKEDMVVAVEPFASNGAGIIYESSNPTVFMINEEKPVRSRMSRQLLKKIKKYKGLPFAIRWLQKEFGKGKVKLGMRELLQKEIIEEYPPLVDKEDGMVSQAEHTVIIRDEPIITTLRD